MAPALETVEVDPPGRPDYTVILMHGLGADGHDFEPIAPELSVPGVSLRWVFPHAPVRPVTLNAGYRMRAWYDVYGFDRRVRQDEEGIRQSEAAVRQLIERERDRGIAPGRVLLAGFSQGGAVALFTGLRFPERLAGLVGLSTWLPLGDRLQAEAHPANAAAPVFVGHGIYDEMVPLHLAEVTRDLLLSRGYAVEWHTYPMAHSVSPEEIAHLRAWLGRMLRPAESDRAR